ncbi:MAG: hypothetical protein WB780_18970 [Candidatus Acidiferrales bacterium]
MTTPRDPSTKEKKSSSFNLSLDVWAVALALGLSALIWAGVIKHVPW